MPIIPPKVFTLSLDAEGKAPAACFPVVSRFGIYTFFFEALLLRVGESSSGSGRIKKGFRDPLRRNIRKLERKNYIAYSWRKNYANQTLRVDFFELTEESFSDALMRRALEAEVTFQFRIFNRSWPVEMSEVHFLERLREVPAIVAAASSVLGHYGIAFDPTI